MTHIIEDLSHFLQDSPTSYHAAQEVANRLALHDFVPLEETASWALQPGHRYFVIRGGSLCAFTLPAGTPERAVIVGAHSDSPGLKLRPHPEWIQENIQRFAVEVYGSPLLTSWLNRDLYIAGRILVTDEHHVVQQRMVCLDDRLLIIPQLALHLDRDVNDKGLVLNPQDHLLPIAGLVRPGKESESCLTSLLQQHIPFKQLLGFDLFLVPIEPVRFLGTEGELLTSTRLDNLAGAHACVTAIGLATKPADKQIQCLTIWDHEEIGSRTDEGAASPFLADILQRIACSAGLDAEAFLRLKRRSFFLSVDAAHAWNPNYASKYEPNHRPLLAHGPVIKYNADCRYATTGASAAIIARAAQALGIPLQSYSTRGDLACGSTIGPIVSHRLGIPTADIGVPLLSMHSIREIIACQDHLQMCHLLSYFLQDVQDYHVC